MLPRFWMLIGTSDETRPDDDVSVDELREGMGRIISNRGRLQARLAGAAGSGEAQGPGAAAAVTPHAERSLLWLHHLDEA